MRVVVGVVVHHTVASDLGLAHTALLLPCLVAGAAESFLVLGEEFPVKFLLAAVAAETFLVENLAERGAAVIRQFPAAVVAAACTAGATQSLSGGRLNPPRCNLLQFVLGSTQQSGQPAGMRNFSWGFLYPSRVKTKTRQKMKIPRLN